MEEFTFASSNAVDFPVHVKMSVRPLFLPAEAADRSIAAAWKDITTLHRFLSYSEARN